MVVEAIGGAAEVFDGDALPFRRQVDLQDGVTAVRQDVELQALVFEAAGGGGLGAKQKAVVQLDTGEQVGADKAGVFEVAAVGD